MYKKYFFIGFFIGLLFGCCYFSFKIGQSYPNFDEKRITRDTLIVRDTLTIKEPIEKIRWKDKLVYIPINNLDTIYRNDTIYMTMQTEKVKYKEEEYEAIISGIYPKLESISVYPKTVYIKEVQENIINNKKHWNFNVSVGPGIFYNEKINYGIGAVIGFGYNF